MKKIITDLLPIIIIFILTIIIGFSITVFTNSLVKDKIENIKLKQTIQQSDESNGI